LKSILTNFAFLILLISLLHNPAHSQEWVCATINDTNWFPSKIEKLLYPSYQNQRQRTRYYPIEFHVQKTHDGKLRQNGQILTPSNFNDLVEFANQQFNNINIQFYISGFNIYENDVDWDKKLLLAIKRHVNVFLLNDSRSFGKFPGRDWIGLNSITNRDVFIHELGHFFGLYHTHHGRSNSSSTSLELVDGSNCFTAGDFICDTPADPNSWYECNYERLKDANGDTYNPDSKNFMSYSGWSCWSEFSPQQWLLMYNVSIGSRAYMVNYDTLPPQINLPHNIDVVASPIDLVETSGEAIYNGPGVVNNNFDPLMAGLGSHIIQRTASAQTKVVPDFVSLGIASVENSLEHTQWQSFYTQWETSLLVSLSLRILSVENTQFMLNIFQGKGISGPHIYQKEITYPDVISTHHPYDSWVNVEIDSKVEIKKGQDYSVSLQKIDNPGFWMGNNYPGNIESSVENFSFSLITNVEQSVEIQTAKMVNVYGIVPEQVTLYPNPVQDFAQMKLWSHIDSDLQINIKDNTGKLIYQDIRSMKAGRQIIELQPQFRDGLYHVHVQLGEKIFYRKLIIKK